MHVKLTHNPPYCVLYSYWYSPVVLYIYIILKHNHKIVLLIYVDVIVIDPPQL